MTKQYSLKIFLRVESRKIFVLLIVIATHRGANQHILDRRLKSTVTFLFVVLPKNYWYHQKTFHHGVSMGQWQEIFFHQFPCLKSKKPKIVKLSSCSKNSCSCFSSSPINETGKAENKKWKSKKPYKHVLWKHVLCAGPLFPHPCAP